MKKSLIIVIISVLTIGIVSIIILNYNKKTNESKEITILNRENENKNNLNNDNDIGMKIKHNNKEIYFEEGRRDPKKQVFYSEYNLIVYDTINKTKETIANTFSNNVVLYEGKLYYFVSNFDNNKEIFYCYNIDTKEKEDLKMPYQLNIYSIVAYNSKVYFGVNNSPIGDTYGIFEYDIKTKEYNKYSELDIRSLDKNFLYVNDGFLTVHNNELIHLDLLGKGEIKYKLSEKFKEKIINEDIIMTEPNVICLGVSAMVTANGGVFWDTVGKIYLNISQDYKLIKTEILDKENW